VLMKVRARGIPGRTVFLADSIGSPADLVAPDTRTYDDFLTAEGLARLAAEVDGISVSKKRLLRDAGLVARAHSLGLVVFCWTLRAENKFLTKALRGKGAAGDYGDWLTEFRLVIESGVDGVFADQPDLAVAARASLGSAGA
jgi:glycerophosphoryl diester phosphodiesterase